MPSLSRAIPITLASFLAGCGSTGLGETEYYRNIIKKSEQSENAERKLIVYGYAGWPQGEKQADIVKSFLDSMGNLLYEKGNSKESPIEIGRWYVVAKENKEALENMITNHPENKEFVLIGHSDGCKNALEASIMLDNLGIDVRTLVYYDAFYSNTSLPGFSSNKKIPKNVKKLVNFISSGPFEGRDFTKEDIENTKTEIINEYLKNHRHYQMYSRTVIDKVVEEIIKQ